MTRSGGSSVQSVALKETGVFDVVHGVLVGKPQECRKQLHEAVIGAYEQAISQGQDTVAKHHGMQAPEGQPMEMAGM